MTPIHDDFIITLLNRSLGSALANCAKRPQPTLSEQEEERDMLFLLVNAINLSEWVSHGRSDEARDLVNNLKTYAVEIRMSRGLGESVKCMLDIGDMMVDLAGENALKTKRLQQELAPILEEYLYGECNTALWGGRTDESRLIDLVDQCRDSRSCKKEFAEAARRAFKGIALGRFPAEDPENPDGAVQALQRRINEKYMAKNLEPEVRKVLMTFIHDTTQDPQEKTYYANYMARLNI